MIFGIQSDLFLNSLFLLAVINSSRVRLNSALTDFKGSTNFICCSQKSVRAIKKIKENNMEKPWIGIYICYRWYPFNSGSLGARFNCIREKNKGRYQFSESEINWKKKKSLDGKFQVEQNTRRTKPVDEGHWGAEWGTEKERGGKEKRSRIKEKSKKLKAATAALEKKENRTGAKRRRKVGS